MDRNDAIVPLDDEDGTGFWDTQPGYAPGLQPWQQTRPDITQGSLGSGRRPASLAPRWWGRLLFWGVVAVALVSLCWLLVLALEPAAQRPHRQQGFAMAAPLLNLELLASSGVLEGVRRATWWERLRAWLVQGSPLDREVL